MTGHISYMLDSMITAVDQSLSYDGIVSVPETGLEDVTQECRLAESLRDGVDRVRNAAISQGAGRAAKVFKPKKRQHASSHLVSDGYIREKNHSDLSDELCEGFSDLQDEQKSFTNATHSEADERNRFVQSHRSPNLVNEMTDMTYGGCLPRPPFDRSHSEPISGRVVSTSHPELKVEEEWQIISPVVASQEGLPPSPGRSQWKTRLNLKRCLQVKTKSVQLSEMNEERE